MINQLILWSSHPARGQYKANVGAVRNTEFVLPEECMESWCGLLSFQFIGDPTFPPPQRLWLKRVCCGVMVRDWVYRVQYQAAARYYFDKDLVAFARVRKSFRVTEKPSRTER